MALELNKVSAQVDQMGRTMAERHDRHDRLIQEARARLAEHAPVTQELLDRIVRAHAADQSWRGAEPLCDRLDERRIPAGPPLPVTLIAADGSQIYPDRHAIATYYLLNAGSIVLRQGSGQAPSIHTTACIFFQDDELYDEAGHVRNTEYINRQRDHQEMETLAGLAEAERGALGGDISRPILALTDGPLLPWMPQRTPDKELHREVDYLTGQLERMRRARVIPVGYVDRPNSSYVLRTLEVACLALEDINRAAIRQATFRLLADRLLFAELGPNERTGAFASTSEINDRFAERGQRIAFFYANMGSAQGPDRANIARIELPVWAAGDPDALDLVQNALYSDCVLGGFPYVLMRAHELAVVGTFERANLEAMLGQSMLRCGMLPSLSAKAEGKRLTGSRHR